MDQAIKRAKLYKLLSDLPPEHRKISAVTIEKKETKNYVLEKLAFDFNGIEDVFGYFIKPIGIDERLPVVLYNHAHGGDYHLGKEEFIKGRSGIQNPPYADVIAKLGFAGLCIDSWLFGERSGKTESSVFKQMLWEGKVLWGMMVYDHIRAIDYLVSRRDIDPTRIGTMGLSMGSTMAWWLTALDTRVKVCIDICCLTDFHSLIKNGGLDGHGIYYYVPSLLKYFTTAEINSLIVPRYHLSIAGIRDALTPSEGLDKIDKEMKRIYKKAGCPQAWELVRYDAGHGETLEMRRKVVSFLKKHL